MPTDVVELSRRTRLVRRDLDREVGEVRALAVRGLKLKTEVASLQTEVERLDRVSGVLTSIGEERQQQAQLKIEGLVTHGLRTIFGEDLSFHVVSSVQRKTAVTEFIVRSTLADGTQVDTSVMDARGGGLAAIVGFLLRLVVLLLSQARQAPVLVLDETFAHLSADFEPRLAEFLQELVERTPVQVVMVTHSTVYSDFADTVYRFSLEGGATRVAAG